MRFAAALFSLVLGGGMLAHPLGEMRVARYSRLELAHDHIQLLYVAEFAELATLAEIPRIDRDADTVFSPDEQMAFAASRAAEFAQGMELIVNGEGIIPSRGVQASPRRSACKGSATPPRIFRAMSIRSPPMPGPRSVASFPTVVRTHAPIWMASR